MAVGTMRIDVAMAEVSRLPSKALCRGDDGKDGGLAGKGGTLSSETILRNQCLALGYLAIAGKGIL